MAFADECYEQLLQEQYSWREEVEDYMESHSLTEVLQDTRETLQALSPEETQDKEVVKARSIFIKGVASQSLTDRQKYALASFILNYE